jgi:hypothetical protein
MTMTLISTVTVGAGGASSISFSSIPSTYTDLLLVRSMRTDSTAGPAASANITFNSSSTGYSERILYNNTSGGGAASSRSGSYFDWAGLTNASGTGSTANTFSNASLYIPNYASSNQKSVFAESMQEANETLGSYWNHYIVAGLWNGTSAITSIQLTSSAGNFMQYSTASLYGIKSGSGGASVSP